MKFYNYVLSILAILSFFIWCRSPKEADLEPIYLEEKIDIYKPKPIFIIPEPIKKDYIEVEVEVTAYCPCEICCGEYADGKTVTGKNAYLPGIAVDKKIIKLGTLIDVPGYGKFEADDIGGAIKGNKIDIRFKSHREALKWGRRKLKVKIYLNK